MQAARDSEATAGAREARDWQRSWSDAAAFVLSCPGPLRRHAASLFPASGLVLPQCLLGGEAQLLAFVAANPQLSRRLFFAPLPEVFSGPEGLAAAWRRCGEPAHEAKSLVHLRFGSTRMARILKNARNGAVVAEQHGCGPLTASHHPFATGLALPAVMRRVFIYGPDATRPHSLGGAPLPVTRLPPECLDADLKQAALPEPFKSAKRPPDQAGGREPDGLDIVAFADFRSGAWAAGPIRARPVRQALREARDGAPFVLLPWNMDHPGSVVPEILTRLARLQDPAAPLLGVLVMPFNYLGQTGIIRRLIADVRDAANDDERILAHLFLGRLNRLSALPQLAEISRVAWIDGNDPEHAWSMARLTACGLAPVLLSPPAMPGADQAASGASFPCEELISIEAETRYGLLSFPAYTPSLRGLRALLAFTASLRESAVGRRPAGRSTASVKAVAGARKAPRGRLAGRP